MSYYRQQLEDWLATLEINADTVFDIGGAQGEVIDRVAKWIVRDYRILDLPDFDIENDHIYNYYFGENKVSYYQVADIVFCLEVFEYLINPIQAMGNIVDILKPGGKAYVTFQFVYPHHNELEMDSLRYTEFGVRRLAKKVGLEIKDIHYRIDRSGLLKDFYLSDGMRMAKQYDHHNSTGFIVELTK